MVSRTKDNSQARLVWADLEMTGLNENECVILQVAMVITDGNMRELCAIDIPIWQPESELLKVIPFIRDMHTQNGLLKRVRASSISVEQAQIQLMTLLTQHVPYKKGVLVGNSMYVDRRFLQKYMPNFESYLHYRQVDVSSLKVLCQQWYGSEGTAPKKPSTHTALEDIRQCMEELKYYKEKFFITA